MKKILALLLWLGGSVAFGQSVQGTNPSLIGVDGANTTLSKVLVFPQVQATLTYNLSPTPTVLTAQPTQVSNWFPLNGNGAAMVEFASNTFVGYYAIEVSNNPTPVSTPGNNIYTAVRDCSTNVSGGGLAQTLNWDYTITEGWKWMRLKVIPESTNGGTLNCQVRLFGNPVQGDAVRIYQAGPRWKASESLEPVGTTNTTVTQYAELKLPKYCQGINLYTNVTVASGATTLTTTVYEKDPVTGQLQSIGVGTANHVTGFTSMLLVPSYASPYPVATPPAGVNIIALPLAQDLVVGNACTGTGTTTYSQTAAFIQ